MKLNILILIAASIEERDCTANYFEVLKRQDWHLASNTASIFCPTSKTWAFAKTTKTTKRTKRRSCGGAGVVVAALLDRQRRPENRRSLFQLRLS
jgi:hypothetical protein